VNESQKKNFCDKRRKFESWKIDKTDGSFLLLVLLFFFGKCKHVVCTDDYVKRKREKISACFPTILIEGQGQFFEFVKFLQTLKLFWEKIYRK
jgi:hypothetical protein